MKKQNNTLIIILVIIGLFLVFNKGKFLGSVTPSTIPLMVQNIESIEAYNEGIGYCRQKQTGSSSAIIYFQTSSMEILAQYGFNEPTTVYPNVTTEPKPLYSSGTMNNVICDGQYFKITYDGGKVKHLFIPYFSASTPGIFCCYYFADDGSSYTDAGLTQLAKASPQKVKFRTNDLSYSSTSVIAFNPNCNSSLIRYIFKSSSSSSSGTCEGQSWNFIMGPLPGKATSTCTGSTNLYYQSDLARFQVCCNKGVGFTSKGYEIGSGTESHFSKNLNNELLCTQEPPQCIPNCTNKVCGDDNCGGSCGTCQSGYTCTNYQCVQTCVDTTWSPLPSDVCLDEPFTQVSNCQNTRQSTGTKDCSVPGICTGGVECEFVPYESCNVQTTGCTWVPSGSEYCGDGTCGSGETCSTCPSDCGQCQTTCTTTAILLGYIADWVSGQLQDYQLISYITDWMNCGG